MSTIIAHSLRFWDPDRAELVSRDPYEHPSYVDQLGYPESEFGWDDPQEAADAVLEACVVDDARLVYYGADADVVVGEFGLEELSAFSNEGWAA